MKLFIVFVVFAISTVVKGAFWAAAAVEPVILGFGSLFAAFKLAKMPDLNVMRYDESDYEKYWREREQREKKAGKERNTGDEEFKSGY